MTRIKHRGNYRRGPAPRCDFNHRMRGVLLDSVLEAMRGRSGITRVCSAWVDELKCSVALVS